MFYFHSQDGSTVGTVALLNSANSTVFIARQHNIRWKRRNIWSYFFFTVR